MATLKVAIDARKAKQGAREFDQATDKMKRSAGSAGRAIKDSFSKSMKGLLSFGVAAGGLYAVTRGLTSITKAAMVQEDAERALAAAISTSSGVRDVMLDRLEAHAAGLQRLTIYGDEEILSQMAYAKNLGVTTDKLDEAATAAIGLATKYRIDLASAMQLIGRASQGQTQMLTRYGIILDSTLTDQEKFDELLRLGADNFDLAEAAAGTASGKLKQFEHNVGDLQEALAIRLLPALTSVVEAMNQLLTKAPEVFDVAKMAEAHMLPRSTIPGPAQQPPRTPTAEQKAMAYLASQRYGGMNKQTGRQIPSFETRSTLAALAGETELTADVKKAAAKRLQIQIRLMEDMGRYDQQYLQTSKELLSMQRDDYAASMGDQVLAHEWYASEVSRLEEGLTDEVAEANSDRARAVERMYSQIEIYDERAYQARLSLLNQELQEFERLEIAKTDIKKYEEERRRQLELEYAQWGDDFGKGYSTMTEQLELDRLTLGRVGGETARSIHSEWVGAFQDMATEGASWKDSMEGFFRNVGDSFSRLMAQMAAEALLFDAIDPAYKALGDAIGNAFGGGGYGGAGTGETSSSQQFDYQGVTSYHAGGIVGQGGPRRMVDPSIFAFAPRLHNGLRPNEFPAILEQGERVTPKGESDGRVEVRISNEGEPKKVTRAESYMVSDRRIIDVSIKAMSNDMTYRKTHGG